MTLNKTKVETKERLAQEAYRKIDPNMGTAEVSELVWEYITKAHQLGLEEGKRREKERCAEIVRNFFQKPFHCQGDGDMCVFTSAGEYFPCKLHRKLSMQEAIAKAIEDKEEV